MVINLSWEAQGCLWIYKGPRRDLRSFPTKAGDLLLLLLMMSASSIFKWTSWHHQKQKQVTFNTSDSDMSGFSEWPMLFKCLYSMIKVCLCMLARCFLLFSWCFRLPDAFLDPPVLHHLLQSWTDARGWKWVSVVQSWIENPDSLRMQTTDLCWVWAVHAEERSGMGRGQVAAPVQRKLLL